MKSRLASLLKASPLWSAAKFALPRYHRPALTLLGARLTAVLSPGAPAQQRLAQAWLSWARLKLYEESHALAEAACGQALALDPNLGEAFIERGHARVRQGRAVDAAADYESAIAILGERADLRAQVANTWMADFDAPGHIEEASRHFDKALTLAPNDAELLVQAGMVYRYSGEYAKAEPLWARALAIKEERRHARGLDGKSVRFIRKSWVAGIGQLAQLDSYVKMGLLGWRSNRRTVVCLDQPGAIANRFLLEQWQPHIEIISTPAQAGCTDEEAELLQEEYVALSFPDGKTRWFASAYAHIQQEWERQKRPQLLRLSDADAARGRDALSKLGVPRDAWFAALHVREPGFWKNLDAAHPTTRDASIEDYIPAIKLITDKGGWVVRLGDPSMKPLPKLERVIDYPHAPLRADWLDVYFAAAARFFVGTPSGFGFVPSAYGVPCAWTNWSVPGIPPWYGNSLWIPKLVWKDGQQRRMSFDELFRAGLAAAEYRRQFEAQGCRIADNTPAEIEALVAEMLEIVECRAAYTPEDQARQDAFWRVATAHGCFTGGRLGREFMRANADLLSGESGRIRRETAQN